MLRGRTVLVTGGAGFIGKALANSLSKHNDVIAVDDLSRGAPTGLSAGVELVEQSVLGALPLDRDVDVVVHLAGLSSLDMHRKDPRGGVRTSVEGFVNVLERALEAGVEDVVYASTSSVYDSPAPASEHQRVRAGTRYEASKLATERYAEAYANRYGLNLAGLRLFSVYGGPARGEQTKGEYANVITQFADAIARGERPVVYGDGSQTRDFVHVDDVVRAMERAVGLDGVYNVGTGTAHSFNRVVALLNSELGTDIDPNYVENPIPESAYVTDTCADSSRFRARTGWEPTIPLEEGIGIVCAPYVGGRPSA